MENSFRKDNLTLSPFSFLSRIGIIRECCKTLDEELRPPESIIILASDSNYFSDESINLRK